MCVYVNIIYLLYIYIMESGCMTMPSQIHNYNSGHHFSLCTPTQDGTQAMSYIHKFMNKYFTMVSLQ